jgi:cytidine deaminase
VTSQELIARALAARQGAYAPYSRYQVGAAIETASGRIYGSCNVENVSYGLTVCAERTAVLCAICAGERQLVALAVVTADGSPPCGACRQVLAEFAADDLPIYLARPDGSYQATTLGALLPNAFRSSEVRREA